MLAATCTAQAQLGAWRIFCGGASASMHSVRVDVTPLATYGKPRPQAYGSASRHCAWRVTDADDRKPWRGSPERGKTAGIARNPHCPQFGASYLAPVMGAWRTAWVTYFPRRSSDLPRHGRDFTRFWRAAASG
ncbi:uncharacterized protein Tco025E_03776 [Trypanosoma conorhini]|uniref:Uncharacterized protein n=1 Tax=Trypanosoma conorhini TaxID=83891 RepID=A0A3R7PAN2_9TRYP|nr:uncharacterized protein Tco025E_03776 [Trypanosoma conorhini]RNF20418.1 hypothetical protein Tco025E_03776 [Trypanosoma conorhini]